MKNFDQSYDSLRREAIAQKAYESSPMSSLGGWRSPVLLVHGDDDRNVPFSETVDLVAQLRRRQVPFEQLVFPDEVHSFLRYANWLRGYTAAAEFLDRHLAKPRGTTSSGGRDE